MLSCWSFTSIQLYYQIPHWQVNTLKEGTIAFFYLLAQTYNASLFLAILFHTNTFYGNSLQLLALACWEFLILQQLENHRLQTGLWVPSEHKGEQNETSQLGNNLPYCKITDPPVIHSLIILKHTSFYVLGSILL